MRASASLRANAGIVEQPASVGPGLAGGRGGDLFGQHLQGGGVGATAALELQQVLRHGPAVVDFADHVGLGTRTSSKNTWFWISSPEVMTSGRI